MNDSDKRVMLLHAKELQPVCLWPIRYQTPADRIIMIDQVPRRHATPWPACNLQSVQRLDTKPSPGGSKMGIVSV